MLGMKVSQGHTTSCKYLVGVVLSRIGWPVDAIESSRVCQIQSG